MAIIKSVILRPEGLHQPEGWANNEYQKAKGPTTATKTKTNYTSPESGRSSHHSPSLQDYRYWVAKAKNLPAPLALVQQFQMPADTAGLSPKEVGRLSNHMAYGNCYMTSYDHIWSYRNFF
jgi:hypothetical protein